MWILNSKFDATVSRVWKATIRVAKQDVGNLVLWRTFPGIEHDGRNIEFIGGTQLLPFCLLE